MSSGGPSFPCPLLLLPLTFPATVDGLGAGTKLPEPQSTKTQLQVLGYLPSFGSDLLKPLNGSLGQAEVTDRGPWIHSYMATTHGWDVTLGPNHHLVLPRVQQTPVIPISSYREW